MKLILMEDVETLGKLGDTIEVKDGYARNYLIPQKLAVPATSRNVRQLEHTRRQVETRMAKVLEEARTLAEKLEGVTLTFSRKAGESGRLFGSVTNMDIAEALAEQGIEVDRKDIVLDDHIKETGEVEVPVRLHHDLTVTLKVVVEAEPEE